MFTKMILTGLMGFGIAYSFYNIWYFNDDEDAQTPINNADEKGLTKSGNVDAGRVQQNDRKPSTKTVILPQEKKAEPKILFVVLEKKFDDLDHAISELSTNKNFATLKLVFDKSFLLSIDEQKFRRFIARVGDYIYVQRMMSIKDMSLVLREPSYGRVSHEEVEKRGNVILGKEHDEWTLEIRGLIDQVAQVKIVAQDMLLKAILTPTLINDMVELDAGKLSARLCEHLQIENINQQHAFLIDTLQDSAVYDEDKFKPYNLDGNLGAFLPTVEWRNMHNITNSQKEKMKVAYSQFFNDVKNIIMKEFNDTTVCDDSTFDNLSNNHYNWLMRRMKQWVKDVELSTILKNSLFHS